jgi:hypothetical protein
LRDDTTRGGYKELCWRFRPSPEAHPFSRGGIQARFVSPTKRVAERAFTVESGLLVLG